MRSSAESSNARSVLLALLGLILLAAAWGMPARARWLHSRVVEVAGLGTPGLVQVGEAAAGAGKPGPAALMLAAASGLDLPGTNQLLARVVAATSGTAWRGFGGIDPLLGRVPGLRQPASTNPFPTAMELFLPQENRAALHAFLGQSQLPLTRTVLGAKVFAPRQFAAVDRPGGQPLDAVLLMLAVLAESEAFPPSWASEVLGAAAATTAGQPNEPLEAVCTDLLTLSRRLDWTSLRELVRTVPDSAALARWTALVRSHGTELPVLYSAAVLSGAPGGVADRWTGAGPTGPDGVRMALRSGVGATRLVASDARPLLRGRFAFGALAPWVRTAPTLATGLRVVGLGLGSLMLGWGLAGAMMGGGPAGMGMGTRLALGLALGLAVFMMAEPLPKRDKPRPQPRPRIELPVRGDAPASAPGKRREGLSMEPTTIVTIAVFGLIQAAVYLICRRKIAEIMSLPEPAGVRLRLIENEENLFDSGLYVGIAGTTVALVLQVLQMVEVNMLAAYSSNLLGIVTVALIKIGHVRPIKRDLILEALPEAEARR